MLAALAVAALVWVLVIGVALRYRRRRDDALPSQHAENVPLEIAYTVVPVLIVAVLFAFTIVTQRRVNHLVDRARRRGRGHRLPVAVGVPLRDDDVVVRGGDTARRPSWCSPSAAPCGFELKTADVIHSFWVPEFLDKRDLIPGVDNEIDVHVDRAGTFAGRCAEFCGLDH